SVSLSDLSIDSKASPKPTKIVESVCSNTRLGDKIAQQFPMNPISIRLPGFARISCRVPCLFLNSEQLVTFFRLADELSFLEPCQRVLDLFGHGLSIDCGMEDHGNVGRRPRQIFDRLE